MEKLRLAGGKAAPGVWQGAEGKVAGRNRQSGKNHKNLFGLSQEENVKQQRRDGCFSRKGYDIL